MECFTNNCKPCGSLQKRDCDEASVDLSLKSNKL